MMYIWRKRKFSKTQLLLHRKRKAVFDKAAQMKKVKAA